MLHESSFSKVVSASSFSLIAALCDLATSTHHQNKLFQSAYMNEERYGFSILLPDFPHIGKVHPYPTFPKIDKGVRPLAPPKQPRLTHKGRNEAAVSMPTSHKYHLPSITAGLVRNRIPLSSIGGFITSCTAQAPTTLDSHRKKTSSHVYAHISQIYYT